MAQPQIGVISGFTYTPSGGDLTGISALWSEDPSYYVPDTMASNVATLDIDFGAAFTLDKFRIWHLSSIRRPTAVSVWRSSDNVNWVQVQAYTGLSGAVWDDFAFTEASARYWRLQEDSNVLQEWRMYELEIFGAAAAAAATRPTFRTDLRWVGDSAMIVYDPQDSEYGANPFPPVGSVFRNYDPDGNTFPNTNLYSPDLLELIVTLVDEYEANGSADALTVAKMLTAHAVESLKTDLATYTYPLTMMAERYTYSSGWNKSEGDGAEYHMRTTLLAAYAFLRMFANDTADYAAKDLSEWALEMLDTGRKMQQFSTDRADGLDMPTWMSGSMSEWWNEGASNTTPQWAYHPLFLSDVVWLAYTEAITQLGDTQSRRDTGTYLLSDVRDDYIAFVKEAVENRSGLMSDTDGGYVALPYQRFHADGAGAATPMNIYTPASSTPSATADWTSDAMFWTTEGMARAGESQGAVWLATLEALRHGTPLRYYDSYTVSGGATTSPAAAEEVTQASALNARVDHALGNDMDVAWIEASQIDEADQISDGAWTWVGNATDYVEAIATAVCLQALILASASGGGGGGGARWPLGRRAIRPRRFAF